MKFNKPSKTSDGFTLVEVLVVITIMVILTAILIPNIRTVTKDRNTREAARTVGSLLARASQRAAVDGIAGVVLFRNPNYLLDSNNDGALNPAVDFQFAVTSVALLRKVPDYTGDFAGAVATNTIDAATPALPVGTVSSARIMLPVEQADLNLISPGDKIALNNSGFEYTITQAFSRTVTAGSAMGAQVLDLVLDLSIAPNPAGLLASAGPAPAGVPFAIKRAPRVLRSSIVDLPSDFIVDLRFSGFESTDSVAPGGSITALGPTSGFNSNVFEPVPQVSGGGGDVPFVNRPIAILFGEDGQLDQMGQKTIMGTAEFSYISNALGPLFLFVTEYDANSIGTANPSNPLLSDTNLWVSVSSSTGAVNVGYNDPTGLTGLSIGDLAQRYDGTHPGSTPLENRAIFNTIISGARVDAVLGSAAQ